MTHTAKQLLAEYDVALARYEADAAQSEDGSPSDEAHEAFQDTVWALVPNMAAALRESIQSVNDATKRPVTEQLDT